MSSGDLRFDDGLRQGCFFCVGCGFVFMVLEVLLGCGLLGLCVDCGLGLWVFRFGIDPRAVWVVSRQRLVCSCWWFGVSLGFKVLLGLL